MVIGDDKDNENNITVISANKLNNNYNVTEINKDSSNVTNSNLIPRINLPVACNYHTSQIKLYSKMPYRHVQATDAVHKYCTGKFWHLWVGASHQVLVCHPTFLSKPT
jgi:hypothetical protein